MESKPKQQRQRKPRHRKTPETLASAWITSADTNVISEDLYNEPTRQRLDSSLEWVRFFNQNSSFLKNLMALCNYSPTLRRILNDKVNMTTGDGFIPYQGASNDLLTVNAKSRKFYEGTESELQDLTEFIDRVNLYDETLVDVLARASYEYEAFGNTVLEIVRGRVAGESFCYLYHVPLYMVGIRKADETRLINSIGIYDDWERVNETMKPEDMPTGFRTVPLYPVWGSMEDGTERTAIHLKQYAPGFFYWGLPEWISAKFWAEVEYRIARVNVDKLENGLMLSSIVQFFGSMTQEEAQTLIRRAEEKMTGPGNGFKMFIQVLRDEKLKANVIPLEQRHEGQFIELQKLAAQAIVSANRWTMSLAGFATEGRLGTNQQIKNETEYVQNTVIKPRQNLFLSRVINPFLQISAEWMGASWSDVKLGISNNLPVSFMGDIDVNSVLTRNEKRELLGYDPDDMEEQQPISEPEQIADDGGDIDQA
jgi:capsid portal protein